MKRLLVLVPFLMLTACLGGGERPDIGLAPAPEMPDLPPALSRKAEALPPLTGKTVAEREKEGADTDMKYNEKATQLNAIIDAWDCVKRSLKARESAAKCFGASL